MPDSTKPKPSGEAGNYQVSGLTAPTAHNLFTTLPNADPPNSGTIHLEDPPTRPAMWCPLDGLDQQRPIVDHAEYMKKYPPAQTFGLYRLLIQHRMGQYVVTVVKETEGRAELFTETTALFSEATANIAELGKVIIRASLTIVEDQNLLIY